MSGFCHKCLSVPDQAKLYSVKPQIDRAWKELLSQPDSIGIIGLVGFIRYNEVFIRATHPISWE